MLPSPTKDHPSPILEAMSETLFPFALYDKTIGISRPSILIL